MNKLLPARQYLFFLFCMLMLCSACSSRYQNALLTSKTDMLADTIKTVFAINSSAGNADVYRIRPDDILAVRNLQGLAFISSGEGTAASAPTSFRVEADGGVVLPVLGKVMVAGLSRAEARQKIQDAYKQSLLKDPIIELSIVNLKVTLLGEFGSQGQFLLEDDHTSLMDIIGKAGGISAKADPKTLKIIRGDRSNPEIIYINLKNINSLGNPKLILQNNDILYIEPLGIYNTSDKVQKMSTFIQPIMLVLNFAILIYTFTK